MKKVALAACLTLMLAGTGFTQTIDFQHMTRWQNLESELRQWAIQFLETRLANPEAAIMNIYDHKSGLSVEVGYQSSDNNYYIIVGLEVRFEDRDRISPFTDRLSIKIGATQSWEVLYGSPNQYWSPDKQTLITEWVASTWYHTARWTQNVNGTEGLVLLFK